MEDLGPLCDLDLEDKNPNVSHATSAHDDAPTYQVLLRNVEWFDQKILSGQIFPEDLTLNVTFTLRTTIKKKCHRTL